MRAIVGASSAVCFFTLGTFILSTSCAKSDFKPACALPGAATASRVSLKATVTSTDVTTRQQILPRGTKLSATVTDQCPQPGMIASAIENRFEGVTPAGVRDYAWTVPYDMSLPELEAWADDDPCVKHVTDYLVDEIAADENAHTTALPNDPKTEIRRHLDAINADPAYEIFYNHQKGIKADVVIAIVDSGVEIRHEDLRESLWTNPGEIPDNGIDDDHNGYVDDVHGYNLASRKASPLPEPGHNGDAWTHGTKVAGLAAATGNNGIGVAGIAGTAKIMSLNSMGDDSGHAQADTANAIRYAVDNGADIINLSIGSFTPAGEAYKDALEYAVKKGVVVLAAAGNGGYRINANYSAAGQAPRLAGLISVGNFQAANFTKSTKSNYNPDYVEYSAPGTYTMDTLLWTTYPESTHEYGGFSGTSAATPVASGAVALAIGLIKSRGYNYTAPEIERLVLDAAKRNSALAPYFRGGNSLDLLSLARLTDERYPAKTGVGSTPVPGKRQPAEDVSAPVAKEGSSTECAAN